MLENDLKKKNEDIEEKKLLMEITVNEKAHLEKQIQELKVEKNQKELVESSSNALKDEIKQLKDQNRLLSNDLFVQSKLLRVSD
jgi:hypothetical protein